MAFYFGSLSLLGKGSEYHVAYSKQLTSERGKKENLYMTFERPINDEGEEKYTKIATYFLIDIFQIDILKIRDYE